MADCRLCPDDDPSVGHRSRFSRRRGRWFVGGSDRPLDRCLRDRRAGPLILDDIRDAALVFEAGLHRQHARAAAIGGAERRMRVEQAGHGKAAERQTLGRRRQFPQHFAAFRVDHEAVPEQQRVALHAPVNQLVFPADLRFHLFRKEGPRELAGRQVECCQRVVPHRMQPDGQLFSIRVKGSAIVHVG